MKIVPFAPSSYEDFPESREEAVGMRSLPMDRDAVGICFHPDVPYVERDGLTLHLQIFEPVQHQREDARYPLLVYIQGSAWRKQEIARNMIPLERIASRGYVVAVVEYRPSDIAPFPAQVQDAKTAIRFLRREAAAYRIDPDRVAVMGDSSGAHTAVLAGFTADRPELDTPDLGEYPCAVRCIVDYYGPTDVSRMCERPSTMDHISSDSPEGCMIGGYDVLSHPEKVAPTVPMRYIGAAPLPPLLILHGSKDRLVPFNQSLLLYEAMRRAGQDVTLYRVEGADHGGPAFWAENTLSIVCGFLAQNLA
jgi:acetyl esterase/lipase